MTDGDKVEASVWRLGENSKMLASVPEPVAVAMAERYPESIFFFAELTNAVEHNGETMTKVYGALGRVGLSEGQIINAVNEMQNAGILFRERV